MASRIRAINPNAGGVKIPDAVKVRVTGRLERHAAKHFKGKYTRLGSLLHARPVPQYRAFFAAPT